MTLTKDAPTRHRLWLVVALVAVALQTLSLLLVNGTNRISTQSPCGGFNVGGCLRSATIVVTHPYIFLGTLVFLVGAAVMGSAIFLLIRLTPADAKSS